MKKITSLALAILGASILGSVVAAPVTYKIDPAHTYPSFEADHQGISYWRGKFKTTSGTIIMDKAAKTGTVDITIDTNSIDFGHDMMNEHAKTRAELFDTAKFPTATYKGKLVFTGDNPTEVSGDLTLKGITKPVTLKIDRFVCRTNPRNNVETCGGNATATFNRVDFGVSQAAMNPNVSLQIQIEASAAP